MTIARTRFDAPVRFLHINNKLKFVQRKRKAASSTTNNDPIEPRQHPVAAATGPVFSFVFWRDQRGGGEVGDAGAARLGPREDAAREPQDCFQPVGVHRRGGAGRMWLLEMRYMCVLLLSFARLLIFCFLQAVAPTRAE